jgi:hypothetical protein
MVVQMVKDACGKIEKTMNRKKEARRGGKQKHGETMESPSPPFVKGG